MRDAGRRSSSATIPTGVGRSGAISASTSDELRRVMRRGRRAGSSTAASARRDDLEHTEAGGRLDGADPDAVSATARCERGADQCGTLGSGNHFLEVQVVDEVFDEEAARGLRPGAGPGLRDDPLAARAASATRSATTHLGDAARRAEKYGIDLPDRQLACAPVDSPGGRSVPRRRCARAANFALCNRQLLMHQAREVFAERLRPAVARSCGMELVYDVATTSPSSRSTTVDGRRKKVWVHRKGATRAFPPGHPRGAGRYRDVGQPVIIPGDMGRDSLRARRHAEAHERDLRHDLPRGRAGCMSRSAGEARGARAGGSTRSWRSAGVIARPPGTATRRRGAAGGLQGRRRRRRGRRHGGDLEEGGAARPIGVIKG